ncbi:MAG: hypothetical protein RI900_2708 [Actinomycetota bacterium]
MNRREALKKLGAGSAIVVGATAVRTVPAFALTNPTITVPLGINSINVSNTGANMSITVLDGVATCPASAIDCATCDPGAAEVTTATVAPIDTVQLGGVQWGWGNTAATAIANAFPAEREFLTVLSRPIRRVDITTTPATSTAPAAGDQLIITFAVAYTCTYANGNSAEADTVTIQFDWNAGLGQWDKSVV